MSSEKIEGGPPPPADKPKGVTIADPKASIAEPPKASIAGGVTDPTAAAAATATAEGDAPPPSTAPGGDVPPPSLEGDAAIAAAAAAAAAGTETTPPPPPGDGSEPPPDGATAQRKSKEGDAAGAGAAPPEEKKRSIIVPIPTSGKGAIATADKGAVELGVKVKKFFDAAEGQRLKEESQKPLRRPKKIYQNSYRLSSLAPYSRDRVQTVLELTLEEMIEGYYYHSDSAGDLAVKMAEKIRTRVLSLKFERYKVIVMTNVGPLNRQGLHIGFRCLMDQERDTYNIFTAKSTHAFCTAVVYGIYFE